MLIALDRKQSVDFLKEIIASNLVDASWVSIHEQERGNFVIKIKAQKTMNWKNMLRRII